MKSLRAAYLQVFSFDMLSKAFLGVTTIVLIRFMAAQEFAAYTFALSASAVVAQTVSASINRVYIVGVEGTNLQLTSATFLGAQLWGGAILTLFVLPLRSYANGLFGLIVALSFGSILSEFAKTYYQRELAFFRLSMVELVRTTIFAGAVVAMVFVGQLQSSRVLISQMVAMLVVSVAVFRKVRITEVLDPRSAIGLAGAIIGGQSAFVVGYFVLNAIFAQVPLISVRVLAPASMATFGSAFRYYGLLLLALNTAHVVLLPTLQKATTSAEMRMVFERHRRMVALFAAVVLIGAILAQWIIPWVDHGKYPGAISIFRVLAVSAIISFALSPHINVLLGARHFRFIFVLMALGTVLHIGVTVVLTMAFGVMGSACASLAVNATINIIVAWRSLQIRQRAEAAHAI